MTGNTTRAARLEAAAGWYAELQDEALAADVWERFCLWERDPANAAAFREIEATLAALDRSRFARPKVSRRTPQIFVWTGMVAAAAALAFGVFALTQPVTEPAPAPEPEPHIHTTEIGEQREVRLADGTNVLLNTATQVEVAFTEDERLVRLAKGQALFDVQPGEVPFTVEAGERRTTALGTTFDVYLMPDGLAVTLVEGVVRIARVGTDEGSFLAPGEQLRVSGGEVRVLSVDTAAVTGWQAGMLQFRDAPLGDVIAELNRYSQVQLRVDDEGLAAERLSGVFKAGDQELFLESLVLYLPVEVERAGEVILVRRLAR